MVRTFYMVRSAGLVQECLRIVTHPERDDFQEFLDHLNPTGPERGWNIQNDDVPFDQLYLLELRQIASCAFQPVLSFEPMWFYDEQPSSQ